MTSFGWGTGKGRNTMPSTTLKIAVLAPMPSARVSTAVTVNPGDRRNWRSASLMSESADSIVSHTHTSRPGQRSPAYESRFYGDVRVHAKTLGQETAPRSRPGAAPRSIDEHQRSRSHHGTDMGIGSRRSTPLLLCRGCSQLLWLNGGVSILCGQTATGSNFQAAQWLAANGTDRSRQTGAALEPTTGSTACSTTRARPCQSCDLTSGAQAGGVWGSRC